MYGNHMKLYENHIKSSTMKKRRFPFSMSSQVRLFRVLGQLGPNLAQLGESWSQLGPTWPNLNLKIAQDGPKMRQVRPT